ncbi:MAG TPA: hypothetical protein VFP79_19530 [Pseudolabrys sp.]|nr:hypothetical protein [Pseudolabrys sp.]
MLHNPSYRDTRDRRSLRDLFSEVGNQITGSDIESGYSFVYTWLANQFGHFMIGFAGTILFGWVFIGLTILVGWYFRALSGVDYLWLWPLAGTAVAVVWFVGWVLKEWLVDVASALRDLHFAERQRQALLRNAPGKIRRPEYILPKAGDWKNVFAALGEQYITRHKRASLAEWFKYDVVRDSQMDICCYLGGMLTGLAMYAAPGLATRWGCAALTGAIPLLTLVAVLTTLLLLARDWLWANIAFDRAQLPFVSRFVLNARPPEEETRREALAFATRSDDRPGHLVIIGPPKSGRTTTAVALGVEALLQTLPPREVVVYTTLCKLLDRVAEERMALTPSGPSGPPGERPVWPPAVAELLIVDDVGAQGANGALLTAAEFEEELRTNDLLRQMCDGKHVIWVVGDDPAQSQEWIAALRTAFTHDSVVPSVISIELQTPIPRAERLRSGQQRAKMSAYGT